MQSAWTANNSTPFPFQFTPLEGTKSLMLLYFAKIKNLSMCESRTFYVTINGERKTEDITLMRNYTSLELAFQYNKSRYDLNMVQTRNSSHSPLFKAIDYFYVALDLRQPLYKVILNFFSHSILRIH